MTADKEADSKRQLDIGMKITEEGLAKMRSWIGKPGRLRYGRNTTAGIDNIRHWTQGYGDDNPLWSDEDYAKKTKWGTIIAPPGFEQTYGQVEVGGLPGVHALYTGDEWEFFQPIRVDDKITFSGGLIRVNELPSKLAGRTIEHVAETIYTNQDKQVVTRRHHIVRRFERKAAQKSGKYSGVTRRIYTPAEIEAIDADYDKEERRGATPRYWEDVNPGDSLGHVVKGPLTLTDIVAYYMGQRPSAHVWAHKLFLQYRREHPRAATLDKFGIPGPIERVHYDDSMATDAGVGASYDFGDQRIVWTVHLLTNWMGDAGFLRKLGVQIRRPNYIGDTSWFRGKVIEKEIKDGLHLVHCEMWGESQRAQHTKATATIELPSRG
ncbi:MaoC family dehydratase N-terminal domain-containing protein [Chloroflexota bacterium]